MIEKITAIEEIHAPEVLVVLKSGFNELKNLYNDKKRKFPKHFDEYMEKAKSHVHIRDKCRNTLDSIKESLAKGNGEQDRAMLYLLYIDRNLFYHTTEAIKMGMSYENRLALMKLLYNMLNSLQIKTGDFL